MHIINRFGVALQFLTRLPLPWQPPYDEHDFPRALHYAPLVGAVLGAILAAIAWLLGFIAPPELRAMVLLVAYIWLTGGLHLDGLGDTFDGLGSGKNPERMLEIMRDSRIGSSALLAILAAMLLNWSALMVLPEDILLRTLLLYPVLGRMCMLISAASSSYARSGPGLGRAIIEACSFRSIAPWLGAVLLYAYACLNYAGLLCVLFAYGVAWALSKSIANTLGGATGDTLGAVLEISQVAVLVAIACLYYVRFM